MILLFPVLTTTLPMPLKVWKALSVKSTVPVVTVPAVKVAPVELAVTFCDAGFPWPALMPASARSSIAGRVASAAKAAPVAIADTNSAGEISFPIRIFPPRLDASKQISAKRRKGPAGSVPAGPGNQNEIDDVAVTAVAAWFEESAPVLWLEVWMPAKVPEPPVELIAPVVSVPAPPAP